MLVSGRVSQASHVYVCSKVKIECLLPKTHFESNEGAWFKRRRKVALVPPSRTVVAGICDSLISMASRATEYVIEIMFKYVFEHVQK